MTLFVTATGSDVGKTVVCALLAHRYATPGPMAKPGMAYWKPVATGVLAPMRLNARRAQLQLDEARLPSDSETFAQLAAGRGHALPEAYTFAAAVAPHWAARQARAAIDLNVLSQHFEAHRAAHEKLVVEGVGGLLVPLNDRGDSFANWLAVQNVACVVVAHTGLGTLNHTLLTLEALRHRHIRVAGLVLCGPAHPDNRRSLAAFGKVPIIDSVPWLTPLNAESVARHARTFDTQGLLAPYLAES